MNVHDCGAFVRVEFEPADVARFRSSWPCFHGPDRVTFEFQRSNGDLVDMSPSDFDGPEAMAMSQDAWTFYVENAGAPATWDRFDICEAWSLLAHDFGLYGIADQG